MFPLQVTPPAIADATTALTDLGLLPVILIGAVLFIAGVLYKRFRR